MTYVITEPCIGTKDQSCVEVCPVDCIYDGGEHFMINPEECIDCGACEPECPVEAIYPEDEVPEDMQQYVTKAQEFFGLT
ncbi:ferredoxin [Rubrobacter xylanophilus]|uniref:Ferredoxin n=1 Tax=Rubrobacter xylanophilus TaxID=49319 RepID=A0A510HJB4_9ACTN|nr:ferredoxin family protein [Rubrobacter xylanophilus]BBL80096.1 ferredoxin [Rubrobacter xylanophilus]